MTARHFLHRLILGPFGRPFFAAHHSPFVAAHFAEAWKTPFCCSHPTISKFSPDWTTAVAESCCSASGLSGVVSPNSSADHALDVEAGIKLAKTRDYSVRPDVVPEVLVEPDEVFDRRISGPGATKRRMTQRRRYTGLHEGRNVGAGSDRLDRRQAGDVECRWMPGVIRGSSLPRLGQVTARSDHPAWASDLVRAGIVGVVLTFAA